MITVGPFTIVCTSPADADAFLALFGKIATTRTNNTVAFDHGATVARRTATRPTHRSAPAIDISDFMGRRRSPTV